MVLLGGRRAAGARFAQRQMSARLGPADLHEWAAFGALPRDPITGPHRLSPSTMDRTEETALDSLAITFAVDTPTDSGRGNLLVKAAGTPLARCPWLGYGGAGCGWTRCSLVVPLNSTCWMRV